MSQHFVLHTAIHDLYKVMVHGVQSRLANLETVLHPSRRRLCLLGIFTIVGHSLCWWLWAYWIPQSFESMQARALIVMSGVVFFFQPPQQDRPTRWMRIYFGWNCWLQLPVFFIWMYWMNAASEVWMASTAIMIVVYFHLTDWRLATLGLVAGGVLASLLALMRLPSLAQPDAAHVIVFLFASCAGFVLAVSSASLRRERLNHSLAVMGIMAHELRTPIATVSLIAQALRSAGERKDRIESLSHRLDQLARAIHHHIDSQMMNARLMRLPQSTELISASSLVKQTLKNYPFNSSLESRCVELIEHQDFWFTGSNRLFVQVLDNLIKNALHSLKTAQSRLDKGDLRIIIGCSKGRGRIEITDRGVGIDESAMRSLFEPFFSTSSETGHGLGLAYCRQVIRQAGGQLQVRSKPALGATFWLELPCQTTPIPSPQ